MRTGLQSYAFHGQSLFTHTKITVEKQEDRKISIIRFRRLHLTFRMDQGQNCKKANRKRISYFIFDGNIMFIPSVIIYETIAVAICMTLTLTFRMDQEPM